MQEDTINGNAYICGKVTGECSTTCWGKFHRAEQIAKDYGWNPINPLKIKGMAEQPNWLSCMKLAIKHLMECEVVFVLPDYKQSKGAHIEVIIAKLLGIKLIFLTNKTIIEHGKTTDQS